MAKGEGVFDWQRCHIEPGMKKTSLKWMQESFFVSSRWPFPATRKRHLLPGRLIIGCNSPAIIA